jgi:hypothetical protein
LFQQILDIERQINETYEYFSGEPIEHLPYETEEGRLMYEELQRVEKERLDRENKRGAVDATSDGLGAGDNSEDDSLDPSDPSDLSDADDADDIVDADMMDTKDDA